MICPICSANSDIGFLKKLVNGKTISGITYHICPKCRCCYTKDKFIPETDNQGSSGRNEEMVNKSRIKRIIENSNRDSKVLVDFGCGNGQFIELTKPLYETVIGIDKHTENTLGKLGDDSVDIINCVEVIEHLCKPHHIVEEFYRVLKKGGIVYLESSFTDYLGKLSESGYVEPQIGHVLVHSVESIENLFEKFEKKWLNQNVVIFKKV
jgi:SAM-dependent methyltransferase